MRRYFSFVPSTLPAPRARTSVLQSFIALLLIALVLGVGTAQASHFRGASLTWKKLAAPENTIELTITESWRADAPDTLSYNWGDGSDDFTTADATEIATTSEFTVVRTVLTHTYPTAGPFTISGSGCCRIHELVNAPDADEVVQAVVDLRGRNAGSPVITSPIVLQMVKGGVNNVPIAFTDVDGDPVTFRMANAEESAIFVGASAAGRPLSVSANGVLSWDTTFTSVGQQYAVQVIATDNHLISPGVFGQSRVPFDFLIKIVDGTVNHPPIASGNGGPFIAPVGQPFTNEITGTDEDGGELSITHQGLPNGATLTPAAGTNVAQPTVVNFAWTPSASDAGSSTGITVTFTDPTGLQASKSFAISVPVNQPPVANAGADQTVHDTDAAGNPTRVILDGTASFRPDHGPLTYSWRQTDGTTAVTLADSNTARPSFSAPTLPIGADGRRIPLELLFQLDVSDGTRTASDDVLIIIKHHNVAPSAVATVPAAAPENTQVTLDGSASSDPDGDPLSYSWTQVSGNTVGLPAIATNNPTLRFGAAVSAPHSIPGEWLEFLLTVSDGMAASTSAPLRVFIQNVNQAPLLSAPHVHPVFDNVGPVELGSLGFDPDGDPLSYRWIQIAGPTVELQGRDQARATFVAPAVTPQQGSVTLTFKVTASDAIGADDAYALTADSTVDVLVKHGNRAPIAQAGANQNVPEQSPVTLDGSGSYDPDGDVIASYQWTQTGGAPVSLNTTDPVRPTFVAPTFDATNATLTFALVVTDRPRAGAGSSLTSMPSTVSIFINQNNRPPVAVAGSNQTIPEGATVTLDGSRSSDPDGNVFTFFWTQVGGPAAGLSDHTAMKPSFTAPAVDRSGATLVFALQVTDAFGATSNIAQTSVIVQNVNHVPFADAGETQSVEPGRDVSLTGLAIDEDTEETALLTYFWQQLAGQSVVLTGGNTPIPTFRAPSEPTTLKFKLTVTDPNGAMASDEVEVVVGNASHAPIANAGGITIANEAIEVTLDGTLSSDPDGGPLTYSWVQVSGPGVALMNANSATPSFTAPFVTSAGATLKFQLTVTDRTNRFSSDIASVSVVNINEPPSATHAQPSVATLWPPNHQMVLISIRGIVDPDNNATVRITGVTQDEPTNGTGDGDTGIDAVIQADGTVLLRAERSGNGDGRIYRVSFTVSDLEGSAVGIVKVGVPHDKKSAPEDSGGIFISTQ